jgi:hypothetical protein
MARKYRRTRYLIHPSSQLKYIGLTVLATLTMSLFCTYFIIESGELVLRAAKGKPLVSFYSMRQTVISLEKEGCSKDTLAKVSNLKNEVEHLKNILEVSYLYTIKQWNQTKRLVFAVLFCFILCIGLLALLYSHRIAGPLFRMKRYVDMFSKGEDIPPVVLRKNDEFKEFAESLDKLRTYLKGKGLLESKE